MAELLFILVVLVLIAGFGHAMWLAAAALFSVLSGAARQLY